MASRTRHIVATLLAAAASTQAALAQGLPQVKTEFADGSTLRLYGQVNMGVLSFDDGGETNSYGLIDNNNSSTRFGLLYNGSLAKSWKLETRFEAEYKPYSTGSVNILDPDKADRGFDSDNIRKLELAFDNEQFGKFWIGQGSMASDGTAEVDLSGTTVIAYSAVQESAGGQLFRLGDGEISGVSVKKAFTNYDGGRLMRIRYDSPKFNGFGIRVAYGQDRLKDEDESFYDVAATYGGAFGDIEVEGAVSYARNDGAGTDTIVGSASGLHTPTGINLTLAAGDNNEAGSYGYVKVGLKRDFFAVGETALAIDYFAGSDITSNGSDSDSYAVAAVQTIDAYNIDLWLTYRRYEFDERDNRYRNADALFGGLRFRF